MDTRHHTIKLSLLFFLSILALVGMGRVNYSLASQGWGSRAFLIQYAATRTLVMEKTSPYSPEAARQVRAVLGDHFLLPGSLPSSTPVRYTSPLYAGILALPFALINDQALAQAIWITAQEAALVLIWLVCAYITGWRPASPIFLLVTMLTLLGYHDLAPLMDGGLTIWAALFSALTVLALRSRRYELAGVLLLLAFIEPQATLLWVIFVLGWALAQHRWSVLAWFFGALALLIVVGLFLVPGWPLEYLQIIWRFSENIQWVNPGRIFATWWPALGKYLGWALTALLGLLLFFEWWLAWRRGFRWFLWTAGLTLAMAPLIGLPALPHYAVLLILPLILIFAVLAERWRRGGQWVTVVLALLLFVWEWGLFNQSIAAPGRNADPTSTAGLSLIFPMPLLLLIGLYWVRWWAIHPCRTLLEELRANETA